MKPLKPRTKHGPEYYIEEDIKKFLRARGWTVMKTHGNLYQCGFPDLYALHPRYGGFWIEVKNPKKYKFTKAQKLYFPIFEEANIGIWILTEASDEQYALLFGPANWRKFL